MSAERKTAAGRLINRLASGSFSVSLPSPSPPTPPSSHPQALPVTFLSRPAAPFWRWIRRFLVGATAIFLGVVALFVLLRPDLQVVEQVVFEGQRRATVGELRHLAVIANGTRVWELEDQRAARGVERHPWVARAQVKREWPATVRIQVEERVPVALLRADRLFYVDIHGERIVEARPDDLDYPVLSGLSQDLYELHPDLPGRVVRSALELVDELKGADIPAELVSEVVFSRTAGFTVHLLGGPQLLFDLEDFPRQVSRLAELRARGVRLDEPIYVDLAPQTMAIVRPAEVAHAGG